MSDMKSKINNINDAINIISYLQNLTNGAITQTQIAITLGVSRSTLISWFQGRSIPREQQIQKLKALNSFVSKVGGK